MRIDSHHHFWKYSAAEYGWISDEMKAIRRDFFPPHLAAEIKAARIDGVVSVQARQTVEETRFLLDLAAKNNFIKGVVGWAPLIAKDAPAQIEKLMALGNPKLRGFRHVVQGEPDDAFILRDDFNEGVKALHYWGLTYDILIFEKHLPNTIQFVDRHPGQLFIVDHVAKPVIKTGSFKAWAENMKKLAERPNVFCKVSGMVTEADWTRWTPAQLQPYFDTVLDAFTPRRLMFGSDWPVCLVACGYQRWVKTVEAAYAKLSVPEKARIFGETAAAAYELKR
jgi:L-fuconolactonase